MTGFAFALVFSAAFLHAGWNLLAKRASGGAAFIFLIDLCSVVVYAPLAVGVALLHPNQLNSATLLFGIGSALIHVVYFLALQRGYQVGDLSLVYPLARGVGPVLSTGIAIALLHERPDGPALVGLICIIGGVFGLTGDLRQLWKSDARTAVCYGVLTGALIAAYTLWDKLAVSQFAVSPVLLNYICLVAQVFLLLPAAVRAWPGVQQSWQKHRLEVLGVGILSPLAYLLVLIAMVFTPVSYVAPLREVSILVGAILGHRLLAEGQAAQRLTASGAIVLGIVLLALN